MMGTLRLYLRYAGTSVRAQMQYRASTVLYSIGYVVLTGMEFLVIWALFHRFGNLPGWTLPDVAMLFGITNAAFALAEGLARGFDVFPPMVKSGDFDRILLRPRGTAFQVLAQHLQVMRIGRLAQGIAVFAWGAANAGVAWTVPKAALLVLSTAGGAALFSGIFILQATVSFWTVESLEIMNTLTYGGLEATQYPLSIYRESFRRFLTWVVPLATISYLPVLGVLGRAGEFGVPSFVPWLSPAVGFAFLLVALRVWRFGVRHYRSTGS